MTKDVHQNDSANAKAHGRRAWHWLVLSVVAPCFLLVAAQMRLWMSPEGRHLEGAISRLGDHLTPVGGHADLKANVADSDPQWPVTSTCCAWGKYLDRMYLVLRDVPSEAFEVNPWLPADVSFDCGEGVLSLAHGGEAERRDRIRLAATMQMTRVALPASESQDNCMGPSVQDDLHMGDLDLETRRASALILRSYLLSWEAVWHARRGDSANATRVLVALLDAVQSAHCVHGLARLGQSRGLTYRALGVLSATLSQVQISVDQLIEIENALPPPAVDQPLREEILRYAVQLAVAADRDSLLPLGTGAELGSILGTLASRDLWQIISLRIDLLLQLAEAVQLAFPEVLERFYETARALESSDDALLAALNRNGSHDHVLSSIGAGGLAKFAVERVNMAAHIVATWRVAKTAIALEKYHRVAGHYPSNLEELAPDGGTRERLDPIDGHRLRYRRTTDGFRLYSVSGYSGLLTRPLERFDDGGRTDTEVAVTLAWVEKRLDESMPFFDAFGCGDTLDTSFGEFRVTSDISCVVARRPALRRVD